MADLGVSIHAPAGATTVRYIRSALHPVGFNPRPRGGDNEATVLISKGPELFQSTPPRGRQLTVPAVHLVANRFNPRPRGGDNDGGKRHDCRAGGFNPRPRGGDNYLAPLRMQSIARFNPRPRGGDNRAPVPRRLDQRRFNPRPRGSDNGVVECLLRGGAVSIHAPAGATTGTRLGWPAVGTGFNPRPRGGDNWPAYVTKELDGKFQSTPPRGRQLNRLEVLKRGHLVSIHAPAGATTAATAAVAEREAFQSTPPRGRQPEQTAAIVRAEEVSIHAPAGATTPALTAVSKTSRAFQSTPPRGRQPGTNVPLNQPLMFQSTPPRGRQPAAPAKLR